MKAYEPKWINYILNVIGVNSLRFEGLHIYNKSSIPISQKRHSISQKNNQKIYANFLECSINLLYFAGLYWTRKEKLVNNKFLIEFISEKTEENLL